MIEWWDGLTTAHPWVGFLTPIVIVVLSLSGVWTWT